MPHKVAVHDDRVSHISFEIIKHGWEKTERWINSVEGRILIAFRRVLVWPLRIVRKYFLKIVAQFPRNEDRVVFEDLVHDLPDSSHRLNILRLLKSIPLFDQVVNVIIPYLHLLDELFK